MDVIARYGADALRVYLMFTTAYNVAIDWDDTGPKDAQSYLLRSYFNQGILQLQNGLYDRAHQSFGEVLALDPQDVESARHRQFAERYRNGDLDLLGRIYVRYISPRP